MATVIGQGRFACPQCPHSAADHGTYGCLYGWEKAHYSETILHGCRCNQRFVNPEMSPADS